MVAAAGAVGLVFTAIDRSAEGAAALAAMPVALVAMAPGLVGFSIAAVVLLRGDMDALPVVEENDLPYRSTNGAMHACGHDLHTAGLVGAARILSAHRDALAGDVVFMFQPGEEIASVLGVVRVTSMV